MLHADYHSVNDLVFQDIPSWPEFDSLELSPWLEASLDATFTSLPPSTTRDRESSSGMAGVVTPSPPSTSGTMARSHAMDLTLTPGEKPNSGSSTCQCLDRLAVMLEMVESPRTQTEELDIDSQLERCNEPLRSYQTAPACSHCTERWAYIMLVVALAKSLTVASTKLVQRYINSRHQEKESHPNIVVGAYSVQEAPMAMAAVGALVSYTLDRLSDFLFRLRDIVRSRCEEQMHFLLQADQRVKALKARMLEADSVPSNSRSSMR